MWRVFLWVKEMSENVGAIYYTVEAETAKLISDLENANKRLEMLESGLNKTDASAKKADMQLTKTASAVKNLGNEGAGAERKIGGLVKMLGGLIAVQGVGGLIQMAEGYNEMAERIRMATDSAEEYDMVQKGLLLTANGTYRALSEAQEVYIQTADSLRSLGHSTSEVLDITDSLSYLFVKNATDVQKAQSAMSAFTKAVNKGKVEVNGWESILAAVPTIVNDIADATGKSAEEIRALGFSGDLAAADLNKGLLKSLNSNKAAADGMATTVRDAFTNLRTNLSVYIGEANNSTGATQTLAAAIGLLGDNIDVVVTALSIAGAGALAKYISSLGLAAIRSGLVAVASRNAAAAAVAEAQARVAATAAILADVRANLGLTASLTQLTAAEVAASNASKALTAAQAAQAAASRGLIAALGGPAGIIGLVAAAATGFLTLGRNAKATKTDIDFLTVSIHELGDANLRLTKTKLIDKIDEMKSLDGEAAKAGARMEYLKKQMEQFPNSKEAGNWSTEMIELGAQVETANTKLSAHNEILDQITKLEAERASKAANAPGARDPEADKKLQDLRDELELVKLQGVARAKLQAIQKLGENATKEQREEAEKLAAQIFDIEEKRKKSTKGAAAAAKEASKNTKENTEVLRKLAEQIALAHLEGEQLAVVQARLSMNQYATPEQLESAEKLAIALHKVNEAQKLKTKVGDDPLAYIRGNDEPLSGGAFDDQVARYDAEDKREQERYEAQLVRLRESLEAKSVTMEQYHAEFERAQQNHNDRLNQIDEARTSVMLSTASSAFGEMASLLKSAQGEQSGAYKAMFAISKAFAIADAGIKLNTAIMQAMTAPDALTPAQKFANYAAVASAGVGVLNSISSATFGGRQYGGPTQPGKMYRINENGAPEVFNAANGQQFMMANSRGQVVSNKDATGGNGGGNVYINNYGGAQVEQRMSNGDIIVEIDKRIGEKVPPLMAQEAKNSNSQFRKSMGQYTDVRPRR